MGVDETEDPSKLEGLARTIHRKATTVRKNVPVFHHYFFAITLDLLHSLHLFIAVLSCRFEPFQASLGLVEKVDYTNKSIFFPVECE